MVWLSDSGDAVATCDARGDAVKRLREWLGREWMLDALSRVYQAKRLWLRAFASAAPTTT